MKATPMLRRLICLFICLAMVLQPMTFLSVFAAESTNLFTNGTFADADGDGKADGWSYYSDSTYAEAASSVGEDGITITGESGKRLTVHQTAKNLTAGETYHLSLRYRVSEYSAQNVQVRYNVNSVNYVIAQTQAVTDGWIRIDKDITLPEGATTIKFEFIVNPNAVLVASLNDVSLTAGAKESAAPASTSLLTNATFADADGDTKADGWSYYSTSANPEAASSVGEDGITIAATTDKRLTVHQTATVESGKTYLLTFRYRVSARTAGYLEARYNAGTTVNLFRAPAVTDGWQTVTKEVTPTGSTLKLEFVVGPNADMTLSIDDVYLVEVVEEPEPEESEPVEPEYLDTLLLNGTFVDGDGDNAADSWTYWNGTAVAAPTTFGEDGLTITADSSSETQRLTVHQTASGLDTTKTYLLTGRYNVTATGKGSLEIRYNTSNRLAYHTSVTDGWQTFSQEITGVDSLKLEIVVSSGATLTCSVDDISLVEIEKEPEPEEPEYVDTLLLNGTFLDGSDDGTVPDYWNFWNGTAAAAATVIDGNGLTITADSTSQTQRLSVNQTVTGLDASKSYRFTGEYNITSKTNGALDIGYYANAAGSIERQRYQSATNGVQTFEIIFTGCTSVKLEAAVSSGATMTCTINNFRLEEVPSYTVTFDANGGTGSMDSVTAPGSIVLPECGFTAPEGTTFAGWLVGGEVKAAGETITFGSDITVKAVWDDGNILTNPTYANTDISAITGWSYYPAYASNAGTNYTASVADGVFSGTVLGGSNLILHQTVKMTEDTLNKSYRFTADVKTEDITGYAMFKIYLQDASNKQLSSFSSAQVKGTADWSTQTIEFDVPATVGGVAVASIKLEQYILKGTGTASFRNPKIVVTGDFIPDPEGDPMDSLVKNGGYETTLAGFPASWNLWTSTGGLNAVSDREVFKEGYSSLHLSNVTEGSDSRGSVHQTFTITEDLQELWGQSVKIGQWVKTENFAGDALALRVHYATESGAYISKSLPVASTQDWTYYEYIIDLPNTNFKTIKIENLYDLAQGDVWIDNIIVTGYIKAKGLTLNADKVVLAAEGTKDLTVEFTPSNTTIQEVTWTSSDSSVATVVDGTITAVSEGVATITVTHVDGMEKQIAVLVAGSEMNFSESIAIGTNQNTSKSAELPEGYDYQVAAEPQFGTFLVEGGVYTYYPAKDFSGSDTVTLLVSSDEGECLVVVPLTVTAVNGAPEFDRMTIVTKIDESVSGEFAATDPENDALTFTVVTQPENGTVTINGSSYTFTPNSGFEGYDAVTFQVSDGAKTAEKEVTIYVAPDASALLATVKTGHSRLLADDARFEELKGLLETDSNAQARFAIVKRDADKLLDDPTPVPYECPDGVRLNTQGSKDVLNLAFMYRMTGDAAYLDRAKLELLYLCGLSEDTYIDWHPSHLLDTAMTANGVAIAYDWLYDDLTAEEKAQVEEAIYQNALVEARKQFTGNPQHMFVTNGENWNYICNGGFITAALALAHHENEEYNALAGEIMQRCYASIQYGLPQYAPEGASIEGISYWDYGTRYLVSLLASISSATTNNPFLDTPGLSITAEYPIYLSGKAGSYNYSDNDMVDAFGYLNMWLAHTYGDSSWNWYHKYYMEKGYDPTVYDLLYYYPAEYGGDAPANLDKFYTNQAVTTMRHDFTDPMSSFLGFKGGLNGAPHGDVDIGSFIYDLYGYRWAEDFGKDDYNLTGYWETAPGGTRWNYYRKNAMGHNTLVFNPTKGANQTVGAYAGKTEQVLNQPGGGYTILDLTDAYQDNAVSVKRGFAYFDRTQVLIRDEFTLKAPGTAYWQMHTKASVTISADGKTAILTQGDATVLLKLVGENATDGLRLAAMDATTYEGVEYEGLKSNEGYTKVYIQADGVQKAVFNVLITPVDMETPEVKTLENWSEYDFSELSEPEQPEEPVEFAITKQPEDVTCKLGDSVAVTVEATGEGLTYQWYLRNEGSSSFTVSSITTNTYSTVMNKARANRELYCVITDANGNTLKTNTVKLICERTELVVQQPTDSSAKLGERYCVTVEATGDGLKYAWYFRNEGTTKWNPSGVRDNTYDDVMNKSRAGREVYCVVTDTWGNSFTTDVVKLNALPTEELAIVTEPADVSVRMGEEFVVTVEAQGDSLRYTWYWRTKGQETWNVSGIRDNTYEAEMTQSRHNREVYCVITDLWGETVQTQVATITAIPTVDLAITGLVTDAEVTLEERYCVEVQAVGDGLRYTWYYQNKDSEIWHMSGVRDNTYDDVMTKSRNGRKVYCVVSDAFGNVAVTDTVTLTAVPKVTLAITQQPTDVSAKLGETYCATIEAVGDGVTYQWYFRNEGAAAFTVSSIRDNTYDDVMTVARADREIYCVVRDIHGNSIESDHVYLRALPDVELALLGQNVNASVAMGERYCVEVLAQGDGLRYRWYFRREGATAWNLSSVRDNTYDDEMIKSRADREVYCVVSDIWGNVVQTEVFVLRCTGDANTQN